MQQNQEQYIQEDTVELRELFGLLKKRSKMIISVTAVLTLSAIVYVFFIAKPVYEAKALVQLAQINKKSLESPENIKVKIETIYDVNVKNKVVELPDVYNVDAPKGTVNMLSIITNGYDNASAEKKLLLVIGFIMEEQQEYLMSYKEMEEEKLRMIQNVIKQKEGTLKIYQDYFDKYKEKLAGVSKKDAEFSSMRLIEKEQEQEQEQEQKKGQIEIQSLIDQLFDLRNSASDIKEKIGPFNIENVKVIGGIKFLDRPIKPKKLFIVSLAFSAGLIFSLLLAFSLEFIPSMKKDEEEKQS